MAQPMLLSRRRMLQTAVATVGIGAGVARSWTFTGGTVALGRVALAHLEPLVIAFGGSVLATVVADEINTADERAAQALDEIRQSLMSPPEVTEWQIPPAMACFGATNVQETSGGCLVWDSDGRSLGVLQDAHLIGRERLASRLLTAGVLSPAGVTNWFLPTSPIEVSGGSQSFYEDRQTRVTYRSRLGLIVTMYRRLDQRRGVVSVDALNHVRERLDSGRWTIDLINGTVLRRSSS